MSGLAKYLRDRDVNVSLLRSGWQSIKCPFHGDTNASASVHVDRGKFHCFGCGIYEDLIGLLRLEGMDYAEAKRTAEKDYGESFPDVSGEPNRAIRSRDRLFNDTGNIPPHGRPVPPRRRLL